MQNILIFLIIIGVAKRRNKNMHMLKTEWTEL